jgi:hydroxyacylglutathione hydrolase
MPKLDIHQFPCLSDNYGVLVHDGERNLTASIDAPGAKAVAAALKQKGWQLTHILTTHHHHDHTDGNLALKAETKCTIIGPRAEAAKVPGIDRQVGEGDTFTFGSHEVHSTRPATPPATSPIGSPRTAWRSPATRCLPSAAAASSRAMRR